MELKKPKLILFDYGQTLCTEPPFDAAAGWRAVLSHAVENPQNVTPERLAALALELDAEISRNLGSEWDGLTEVTNLSFQRYLFAVLGLKFNLDEQSLEELFWDTAAPATSAPNIQPLLDYLWKTGIKTGVISNLCYNGITLKKRIRARLPQNHFLFILASSDYVFCKPSPRLYRLALDLAGESAGDAWFCGDNPICDVDGPAAMGMTPVWYKGGGRCTGAPQREHLVINDWREVISLLDSLQ